VAIISWIASQARDDGERGSSLRACDAIQLVVQEEAGLPRRFAPRNDGWGVGSSEWGVGDHGPRGSCLAFCAPGGARSGAWRHCERERRNPVGDWRGV
jgi:hypothetical protein